MKDAVAAMQRGIQYHAYGYQGVGGKFCVLGYRVRYETSASLIEKLNRARAVKALTPKVRHYCSYDLLVTDEFGFEKLERKEVWPSLVANDAWTLKIIRFGHFIRVRRLRFEHRTQGLTPAYLSIQFTSQATLRYNRVYFIVESILPSPELHPKTELIR